MPKHTLVYIEDIEYYFNFLARDSPSYFVLSGDACTEFITDHPLYLNEYALSPFTTEML